MGKIKEFGVHSDSLGISNQKFCGADPGRQRARMATIAALSLFLSGCVASSLTPLADSTVDTSSLVAVDPDAEKLLEGDAPSVPNSAIPVPTPRSGGDVATPATQLALATSAGSDNVAAQKTASVANAPAVRTKTTAARTASPPEPIVHPASPPEKNQQNRGFFATLFGNNQSPRPPKPVTGSRISASEKSAIAKASSGKNRKVAVFKPKVNGELPGVRKLGLFGIYDAKEGEDEGFGNPVLLASVGRLSRTSPNGLRVQTAKVQVACLRPELIAVIKKVQRRYGKVPIVTSGYRSPARNRRARGAKNSLHIYCKAADIQVPGVSKWTLAKYLRSIPGRGGVGTYCSTKSVHIDIGDKRDWNWRCRRGKRKRKG